MNEKECRRDNRNFDACNLGIVILLECLYWAILMQGQLKILACESNWSDLFVF